MPPEKSLSRKDQLEAELWAHQQLEATEKARAKACNTALKRIHAKYDAKRKEIIAGLDPSVSALFGQGDVSEEVPVTVVSEE